MSDADKLDRGQHYEILQFFEHDHLPTHLQEVSRLFAELAEKVASELGLPRCAETTTALRKLLEAKDAAVRAKVQGWPAEQAMMEHKQDPFETEGGS